MLLLLSSSIASLRLLQSGHCGHYRGNMSLSQTQPFLTHNDLLKFSRCNLTHLPSQNVLNFTFQISGILRHERWKVPENRYLQFRRIPLKLHHVGGRNPFDSLPGLKGPAKGNSLRLSPKIQGDPKGGFSPYI